MGEYSDVKRKKILKLLEWLDKQKYFTVNPGANHQWVIKYNYWKRPFPIPFSHNKVGKHYIKDLMKKLVEARVCTKEEFDKKIK